MNDYDRSIEEIKALRLAEEKQAEAYRLYLVFMYQRTMRDLWSDERLLGALDEAEMFDGSSYLRAKIGQGSFFPCLRPIPRPKLKLVKGKTL